MLVMLLSMAYDDDLRWLVYSSSLPANFITILIMSALAGDRVIGRKLEHVILSSFLYLDWVGRRNCLMTAEMVEMVTGALLSPCLPRDLSRTTTRAHSGSSTTPATCPATRCCSSSPRWWRRSGRLLWRLWREGSRCPPPIWIVPRSLTYNVTKHSERIQCGSEWEKDDAAEEDRAECVTPILTWSRLPSCRDVKWCIVCPGCAIGTGSLRMFSGPIYHQDGFIEHRLRKVLII